MRILAILLQQMGMDTHKMLIKELDYISVKDGGRVMEKKLIVSLNRMNNIVVQEIQTKILAMLLQYIMKGIHKCSHMNE